MGAPLFTLWLKALAQLHKASPIADIEFLFIGTGRPDLPSIRGQIEALGISDIAREIPERLSYLSVQKILRQSRRSHGHRISRAALFCLENFPMLGDSSPPVRLLS